VLGVAALALVCASAARSEVDIKVLPVGANQVKYKVKVLIQGDLRDVRTGALNAPSYNNDPAAPGFPFVQTRTLAQPLVGPGFDLTDAQLVGVGTDGMNPLRRQGVFRRLGANDYCLVKAGVNDLGLGVFQPWSWCPCSVGSRAGAKGPGIEAATDTTFASDSSRITVTRAAGSVTLGIIGQLFNNPGILGVGRGGSTRTIWKLAVYKDEATADADVNENGTGAAFFGSAQLMPAVAGFELVTSGGFSNSDFTITHNPDGSVVANTVGALSRTVNPVGFNGTTAIVRNIQDPHSAFASGVPGANPIAVAFLALAMLVAGLWMVRRMKHSTLA
jgi:hypothetical protein